MPLKRTLGAVSAVLLISSLAACGGDDAGSGGGDNSAFEEGLGSRGPITYVQGKDNSGIAQPLVDKWNADHPDEEVTLKEQTDEAGCSEFHLSMRGWTMPLLSLPWT